jgi:hypothetical protein
MCAVVIGVYSGAPASAAASGQRVRLAGAGKGMEVVEPATTEREQFMQLSGNGRMLELNKLMPRDWVVFAPHSAGAVCPPPTIKTCPPSGLADRASTSVLPFRRECTTSHRRVQVRARRGRWRRRGHRDLRGTSLVRCGMVVR